MAKIFGQLERAQLEILGADPSGAGLVLGRAWLNTGSSLIGVYDGTAVRNILFGGIGQILNADVNASAALARTKLASGTANHVLINDGSGVMSSEATLAKSRGGTGADNSSVTFPSTGTLSTLAGVEALTNKDFQGGTASNTSRITLPKAAKATLDALTRKQATIVYASDTDKVYVDNGTTLLELLKSNSSLNITSNTINLSLTYSSGVFTLCAADGSALSATNPAYVIIQKDLVQRFLFKITANRSFQDLNGTSDIAGINFGTTSGIAWGAGLPFYIYASNSNDTDAGVEFFLSRSPCVSSSGYGNANNLAYKGHTPSVDSVQTCFFLTSSSPAAHAGRSCARIGALFASKTSANDWDFTANGIVTDNFKRGIIDNPFEGVAFAMQFHQNGAASGSWLKSAGTVPTWANLASSSQYQYTISSSGLVNIFMTTTNSGNCTNGVGGNPLFLMLPIRPIITALGAKSNIPIGSYSASGAATASGVLMGDFSFETSDSLGLYLADAATALNDSNFSNAANDLTVSFTYQIG